MNKPTPILAFVILTVVVIFLWLRLDRLEHASTGYQDNYTMVTPE